VESLVFEDSSLRLMLEIVMKYKFNRKL
jgi:hypothetical protein